jgi:hypothetical protein
LLSIRFHLQLQGKWIITASSTGNTGFENVDNELLSVSYPKAGSADHWCRYTVMPKTYRDVVDGVFSNKDKLLLTKTYTLKLPKKIGKGSHVYRVICEIPPENALKTEIHLRVFEETSESNASRGASSVRAQSLSGTVEGVRTLPTADSRQDLTGAMDGSTFPPANTSFNTVPDINAGASHMQRAGSLSRFSQRSYNSDIERLLAADRAPTDTLTEHGV